MSDEERRKFLRELGLSEALQDDIIDIDALPYRNESPPKPVEIRLSSFIRKRLKSMLARPAAWGTDLAVETGILHLLDVWVVLQGKDPHGPDGPSEAFNRFIDVKLPNGTPEPLCTQLKKRNRSDFSILLKEFIEEYLSCTLDDSDC